MIFINHAISNIAIRAEIMCVSTTFSGNIDFFDNVIFKLFRMF